MGEVVLSSDNVVEAKSENETERNNQRKKVEQKEEKDVDGAPLVKGERLLPRMVMRVLLVEPDDSTRQIIAALLRKCSYRVASISDGLKAWEVLKRRSHNIDLILTEVDLPSISGYALLTLIMEHEICKNIPVIMMSLQDSINTVYKCMLRGAADYLVKPIRINELRNLWQHVWRRQHATVDGNDQLEESVGQDKVEATSDNNAASNHLSGNIAHGQRNKEYIEKGSDAPSSCTKPDLETEGFHKEHVQDFSLPTWGKLLLNDIKVWNHEANTQAGQKLPKHGSEAEGAMAVACKKVNMAIDKDIELESHMQDSDLAGEAGDNADVLANSSREALDFMGAFTCLVSSSNNATGKFDSSPYFDLSLTRSQPSGPENQINEERRTLKLSTASAFTRYVSQALNSPHSELVSSPNQREGIGTKSGEKSFNNTTGYNSDTLNSGASTQRSIISLDPKLCTQRNFLSLPTCQSKQSEIATSCPQQRLFPVPISVRGARLNNPCRYGSALPPLFCSPSGSSPMVSPGLANQQESTCQGNPFHNPNFEDNNTEGLFGSLGQTATTSLTLPKKDQKLDSLEDRGCISPATDQSASSSFCNGSLSCLNSMGYQSACGSNSNVEQVAVARPAVKSKLEEAETLANDEKTHRSILREAALTKFLLKRKDRCFEKKVRYESRKKLAEQRPRVRGQFVRQAHCESLPAETENHHDESGKDKLHISQG